jgi:hypothetical protein
MFVCIVEAGFTLRQLQDITSKSLHLFGQTVEDTKSLKVLANGGSYEPTISLKKTKLDVRPLRIHAHPTTQRTHNIHLASTPYSFIHVAK